MTRSLFGWLLFILVFYSCEEFSNGEKLDHRFVADDYRCEKWGMAPTAFTLAYMENINAELPIEEAYNQNYIQLIHEENGQMKESLQIGAFTQLDDLKDSDFAEKLSKDLLEGYLFDFQEQYAETKVESMGRQKFGEREVFVLKTRLKRTEAGVGSGYFRSLVALLPPEGVAKNGVLVHFMISEEVVNSFEAIGREGKTGRIWQSFQFLDRVGN